MSSDSQMPWELLRGDTIQAIFRDLGLSHYVGKREDMLGHLQEVEKDGLEAVVEKLEVNYEESDDERERPARSQTGRRRSGPQNDDQAPRNRRGGSRARPSVPRPGNRIASGSGNKPIFEGVILPASSRTRKQILIGVVMPPMSKSQAGRGSMKRKAESDDDEDELEPSTSSQASTKGKRRASRQKTDSDDEQS